MKAKAEEIIFSIGDKVRYILKFKQFEKHTLPNWSGLHTITDKNIHSYKLDNGQFYKYYELQKVQKVQKFEKKVVGPTRQHMTRETTVKRKFKLTGLDMTNILSNKRKPTLK